MKHSDAKVKQFMFLNLYLAAIYLLVSFNLKTGVSDFIMFSTPDSKDYLSIGNWIFENTDTDQTLNNPVLYPVILKILLMLFGVTGVWLVQFLFWLASINFLFYAVKRATNKRFAYIGAVLLSVNLSYIALTLHALTEVTVTFLISWLIFYLSKKIDDFKRLNYFYTILLFFSFLSIIKPVFFPPLLFLLLIVFPLFFLRDYMKTRTKLILLIVLMPVIFQMSLTFLRHDTFSLTTKGTTTLKLYFFAQCYADVNKIKIEDAMNAVQKDSSESMLSFILDHKILVGKKFFENIIFENILGKPIFLSYPSEYRSKIFYYVMQLQNWFFLILHLVFIIPCLYLLYYFWKANSHLLGFYCLLLGLFYYLVLITGIAFWQGDRYTISFQPLWIMIYLFVIHKLRSLYKIKQNESAEQRRIML